MTSEVMREKFNYTQRPAEPRLFLASDISTILGICETHFYKLKRVLNLEYITKTNERGRAIMYFTHASLIRCQEYMKKHKKKKEEDPQAELEAAQAEHPLVTDPRFLKLSYFPDVTPACFEECEE